MTIPSASIQNTPFLRLLSLTALTANRPQHIQSFSAISSSSSSSSSPPPLPKTLAVPPPPHLPSSAIADLSNDGIAILPHYACPDTVALLRFDALRLEHAGLVESAGTFRENVAVVVDGEEPEPYRKCKHFWLSGKKYVGPSYLLDLVSTIEDSLEGTSPWLVSSEDDGEKRILHRDVKRSGNGNDRESDSVDRPAMHPIHRQETEVAYLYYEKGGYFHWHFDTPDAAADESSDERNAGRDNGNSPSHRRAFSFLLYLGGHRPDPLTGVVAPWDENRDGGELRVYPEITLEDQMRRIYGEGFDGEEDFTRSVSIDGECLIGDPTGSEQFTDIVPREGTLVIFKSEAMCHEVLRTNRERLAVVGWIHGDLE